LSKSNSGSLATADPSETSAKPRSRKGAPFAENAQGKQGQDFERLASRYVTEGPLMVSPFAKHAQGKPTRKLEQSWNNGSR
jgi:hypothetical protein